MFEGGVERPSWLKFLWSLKRQDGIREKKERVSLDKRDTLSEGAKMCAGVGSFCCFGGGKMRKFPRMGSLFSVKYEVIS